MGETPTPMLFGGAVILRYRPHRVSATRVETPRNRDACLVEGEKPPEAVA